MPFRVRSGVTLVAFAALLIVAASALTLQRIPTGRIGVTPSSNLPAGWALHRPFQPIPTIASAGSVGPRDISLKTKEGSTLGFSLELRYSISKNLAPQLAMDIRRDGLDEAIAGLALRVLEDLLSRTDVESLLSEPARVEGAFAAALSGAGLISEQLMLRSTIGDEVIRRRRTDEAKALAQSPLARVLVIGLDGADWRTAEPLIAAGRLPNLSRVGS